jgi:hypothetical protein
MAGEAGLYLVHFEAFAKQVIGRDIGRVVHSKCKLYPRHIAGINKAG